MTTPRTLFDKTWESHVVHDHGDGFALVFVDRQVLQDLGAPWFEPRHPMELHLIDDPIRLTG